MNIRHSASLLLTAILIVSVTVSCSRTDEGDEKKPKKSRTPKSHLVVTETVSIRSIGLTHERSGTLRARQSVRIFNQEEGRITELPFYEGDKVRTGERLVRLEDDLLKAELDKASATSRLASSDLRRLQGLAKHKAVSDEELAQARTALNVAEAELKMLKIRLGYTLIQAPFSGVISQRLVEPGDVVSRHTHLLSLIDPESLITEIQISDLLLSRIHLDDPVKVRIDGLGTQRYAGKILRIHPALDPKTRMGIVEVILDPVPEGARSGQLCRVTLDTAASERIMIPFRALQRDNQAEYVYRLDQDDKARRAEVVSGIRVADRVEIIQGLKTDERIVVKGFLGLREDKQVETVD
ncbi:MAG: efflux RND transporter periplasmic adaptor subunit [Pseudomonadota bacterium]